MKIFRRNKYWLTLAALLLMLPLLVVASGCMTQPPKGGSGVIVDGENLFVASVDGTIHLRNAQSGGRIWTVKLEREVPEGASCDLLGSCGPTAAQGVAVYGTPVLQGDYIYVGGYDGRLRVYNWQERIEAPLAEYPAEPGKSMGPIVGDIKLDGGYIYFGSSDGNVYCLNADPEQLVKVWAYPTGDKVWATPVIDNGTLYATSFDGNIYALDAARGALKWEYQTDGAIAAAPLVSGGTLYVGAMDRYLYALNAASGELKWRSAEPAGSWFWTTPLIMNGNIVAGNLDGQVYFYDAVTGAAATLLNLGGALTAMPVADGDNAIFATQGGKVYAVDTVTFRQGWSYDEAAGDKTDLYAPLAIVDGILYLHTQQPDTLYAYDTVTGMSARAPLPLSGN